jgi:hypothetical protein
MFISAKDQVKNTRNLYEFVFASILIENCLFELVFKSQDLSGISFMTINYISKINMI